MRAAKAICDNRLIASGFYETRSKNPAKELSSIDCSFKFGRHLIGEFGHEPLCDVAVGAEDKPVVDLPIGTVCLGPAVKPFQAQVQDPVF